MDARTQDVDTSAAVAPLARRGLFTLSPINRRRWYNFKSNKRGYWSFWIFVLLFFVSLFAEVIANLWDADTQIIWASIISFWFGSQAFSKK